MHPATQAEAAGACQNTRGACAGCVAHATCRERKDTALNKERIRISVDSCCSLTVPDACSSTPHTRKDVQKSEGEGCRQHAAYMNMLIMAESSSRTHRNANLYLALNAKHAHRISPGESSGFGKGTAKTLELLRLRGALPLSAHVRRKAQFCHANHRTGQRTGEKGSPRHDGTTTCSPCNASAWDLTPYCIRRSPPVRSTSPSQMRTSKGVLRARTPRARARNT